jgi:hypothetical protein
MWAPPLSVTVASEGFKFTPVVSKGYICTLPPSQNICEGPKRRPEGGGVNGSQSKFLTEFGLYPKINPNPQLAKSGDAENRLGYSCCAMA